MQKWEHLLMQKEGERGRGRREKWARREKGCSEKRNGGRAKENMKEIERTEEEEVRRKWKNERKKVVKSLEGIAHEKGEEERKTET